MVVERPSSYSERLRLHTPRMFEQGLFAFARKALRKGAYTLRTGYWHTGERCCADFPDNNFSNHLRVYKFAAQFCHGKTILDVGCGTGYGTYHLAESGGSTVGIDLSRQAIRYARRHYVRSNLRFSRMSAESLRFADRNFGFIISTENFEHLRDHRANLREMSRILTDDGMLLLATPNPEMFVGLENPYHTHEFRYEELMEIVQEFFCECIILENMLEPDTEAGRSMREERKMRAAVGSDFSTDASLWGKTVDRTWLSNTHSFFCFARAPRRFTEALRSADPRPTVGRL
jgi:2-polyprenyl-3-methyl-5-hydroxy-6-metoxy-1,4-benzoquinol methylase